MKYSFSIGKLRKEYSAISVPARAAFWFLFCGFIQKASRAIITPILSRLFTTAEYGQYSVFYSWMDIATVFVSLNLSAGVYTQGIVKFESDKSVFSSTLQGLSTTLTIAWTVVYLCFRDFWNQMFSLTTVQMLAMLLMIWATAAYTFWYEEQRVKYNYRALVLVTAFVSLISPIVGFICVMNAEDKVTAWVLAIMLVDLIAYTGPHLIQMFQGKRFFSGRFWKYALAFNIPLVPHYLSQSVLNSSDRIMIDRMVGSSEAGIYGLAYTIAHIMTLFSTALNQTIGPWLYRKIRDKDVGDIYQIAYPSLVLIALLNLGLIAFAPEVIAIFAPPSYHDAIWVIPPVAMSVVFHFSYIFFANFEFYYEKTHYIAIATVGGAVLNIVLNYIFIKQYGYFAAGYTTLFCYFLYVLFHYCSMRKLCRQYLDDAKVYDAKVLAGIAAASTLAGFLLMLTYGNNLVRYVVISGAVVVLIIMRKRVFSIISQLIRIRK